MCSESCLMQTNSDTLLSSCISKKREVGVLSECWKQNIFLLFSGFPSSAKDILNFQNLRIALFSEPSDTDIFFSPSASCLFPDLLSHYFFCFFSFHLFEPGSQNLFSISLLIRKKPTSHCTFPTSTTIVLTQPVFSLPTIYKISSHCPYECYVTPNFSCLLHFSLSSFPQAML